MDASGSYPVFPVDVERDQQVSALKTVALTTASNQQFIGTTEYKILDETLYVCILRRHLKYSVHGTQFHCRWQLLQKPSLKEISFGSLCWVNSWFKNSRN